MKKQTKKQNVLSDEETHLHGKDVANASGTLPEDDDWILKMPHESVNRERAIDPGAQGAGERLKVSGVDPYHKVEVIEIKEELLEVMFNHETD